MSWQVAWGLAVFTGVYALLKSAKMFKRNQADDNVSASIKTLFKNVFIGAALVFSVVAVGNIGNLVDATMASDSNLSSTTEVDNFVQANNALYKGMMWTFVAFAFFLFVFVVYMVIRNLKNQGERGVRGR